MSSLYLIRFFRKLRGSSQPILAQASDGKLYVVKFSCNLQGPNLLFNEAMGSELYRAARLPVPTWTPITVSGSFLDRNPGCWLETLHGVRRPRGGICFGSRFLEDAGGQVIQILPGSSFKNIRSPHDFWMAWLIDVCAQHADRREALFQQGDDRRIRVFFIDNGHLFGGPSGKLRPHHLTSRYLDSRIYPRLSSSLRAQLLHRAAAIDFDRLWKRAQTLPDEWKTVSSLGQLSECLNRLAKPDVLESTIDALISSPSYVDGFTHGAEKATPILRNRIPRISPQAVGCNRSAAHSRCA